MSNFEINVRAIVESAQIQKQLNQIQNNLKPINIGVLTGSGGGLQQQFDGIAKGANVASSAIGNLGVKTSELIDNGNHLTKLIETVRTGMYTTATTTVNLDTQTGKLNATLNTTTDGIRAQNDARKATIEMYKNMFDQIERTNKEKAKEETLNQKNLNTVSALRIRIEGLTDEQKRRLDVENRLNQIVKLSSAKEQQIALQGLQKEINAVTVGTTNFAASLEYSIKRFMEIGVVTLAFRTIKNSISDMVENITGLDSSLVELQKVTDLSGKSLEDFTSRAYDAGNELARTGKDVIDATAIFARSGYEIQDAFDLSKVALMMMNVGDGINSVDEAATSLISVLKGYGMEASQAAEVTDLINEIEICLLVA